MTLKSMRVNNKHLRTHHKQEIATIQIICAFIHMHTFIHTYIHEYMHTVIHVRTIECIYNWTFIHAHCTYIYTYTIIKKLSYAIIMVVVIMLTSLMNVCNIACVVSHVKMGSKSIVSVFLDYWCKGHTCTLWVLGGYSQHWRIENDPHQCVFESIIQDKIFI